MNGFMHASVKKKKKKKKTCLLLTKSQLFFAPIGLEVSHASWAVLKWLCLKTKGSCIAVQPMT